MKIAYDTEFWERGPRQPIWFISIGMVAEDGREYYAISNEVKWWSVYGHEWLRENVLTQLPGKIVPYGNGGGTFEPDLSTGLFKPVSQIAAEVANFCAEGLGKGEKAELWAYYADYDHVVLSQLFGSMMDLPPYMPMYTRDIKQYIDEHDLTINVVSEGAEHNALADSKGVMAALREAGIVGG